MPSAPVNVAHAMIVVLFFMLVGEFIWLIWSPSLFVVKVLASTIVLAVAVVFVLALAEDK